MSRKTRKLIWSAPLVAVLAVAGALAIFVAITPGAALAEHEELPGPVTGLKAEADGRTMMDLSWNAPTTGGDTTHYRIDRSDDTYTWKALVVTTDTATTHTDTRLKPARTYYYRVFAVNSSGTGPVSVEENYAFDTTASTEEPGTLRLVSAVAKSDTQIDLMWNAPSETGGSSIARYCIVAAPTRATYAAPAGCTSSTPVTSGDSDPTLDVINTTLTADGATTAQTIVVDADDGTKYEHKGLVASTTVHYWVHAVNPAGPAPVASNPASATTNSTPTLGPAPRNLRGVPVTIDFDANGAINGGMVDLYWNVPPGTAPQGTNTYTVEYSLNGRDGWTTIGGVAVTHATAFGNMADDAQATHLAIASDVESEKALYYRVKVENSRWATSGRVNLVPNYARPDSLALGDGGSPKAAAVDTLNASADKYLTRIDLKWAFEADDYAVGTGDPVTPATKRPTGFLIDYYIESATDADPPDNIYWQPLQSNTGYSRGTYNHLRGLKPGQTVHYRVFSWHTNNYGIPAATMGSTKMAVSPDPVRGLRTMADGPTKINLDWDAVPAGSNGGSPITHYVIQVYDDQPDRPAGGVVGWLNAGTSMSTTFTFSGVGSIEPLDKLTAEEGAWFRVIAINSVNKGAYDDDSFDWEMAILADLTSAEPKRGETARAAVPLAPQDLTTEPAKDANSDFSQELGILLLWNAPDDPAGAMVTGYAVSRRMKLAGGEWSEWDDAWGSISADDLLRTYFTDTDEPDEGEERAYRVAATSARGDSAWSEMAYAPTRSDTHTPVVGPEVGSATSVTTGLFNEGGVIQVNWDPAPNATGYIIYAVNVDELDDPNGQIVVEPVNDAAAETFNLGGLKSGDTYDIYVVATAKEMVAWPAAAVQVTAN